MNLILVVLAVIAIPLVVHGLSPKERKEWFADKLDAEPKISAAMKEKILSNGDLNKFFNDDNEFQLNDQLRQYKQAHGNFVEGYKKTRSCLRAYHNHMGSGLDTKRKGPNALSRFNSGYNCGDDIFFKTDPNEIGTPRVSHTPCGGSTNQVEYGNLAWFQRMGINAELIVEWMNELPGSGGKTARKSGSASSKNNWIGKSLYVRDSKREGKELSCHFVLTGISR